MKLLDTNYKEGYSQGVFFEFEMRLGDRVMLNFNTDQHVVDFIKGKDVKKPFIEFHGDFYKSMNDVEIQMVASECYGKIKIHLITK